MRKIEVMDGLVKWSVPREDGSQVGVTWATDETTRSGAGAKCAVASARGQGLGAKSIFCGEFV
ncbi:MAG: hypothetical protein ABI651_19655 [Verrucomicrobiota bacterium]